MCDVFVKGFGPLGGALNKAATGGNFVGNVDGSRTYFDPSDPLPPEGAPQQPKSPLSGLFPVAPSPVTRADNTNFKGAQNMSKNPATKNGRVIS